MQLFLCSDDFRAILGVRMMLTVDQVAERFEVTPETIRRWVRRGKIKARKIGYRTLRFRLADFVKFEEGR